MYCAASSSSFVPSPRPFNLSLARNLMGSRNSLEVNCGSASFAGEDPWSGARSNAAARSQAHIVETRIEIRRRFVQNVLRSDMVLLSQRGLEAATKGVL